MSRTVTPQSLSNFSLLNLHRLAIAGGGGSHEVWDRETMFSQLAKRSIRAVFQGGGIFSHDLNFGFEHWVISKEFRILSPPAK